MIQIDMQMPETCKECFARDGVFCKASKYKRISYPELETKAEWCPIHEVTADEDTVSRKAVLDAVLNLNVENRVSWLDAVIDTIDELPPSPSRQAELQKSFGTLQRVCLNRRFHRKVVRYELS